MRAWAVVVFLAGCGNGFASKDPMTVPDGGSDEGGGSSVVEGKPKPTAGDAGATDAGEPGVIGTGGSSGGAAPQAGAGGRSEAGTGGSSMPEGGKGGTDASGGAGTSSMGGASGGEPMGGKAGAGGMAGAAGHGPKPTTRSLAGCVDGGLTGACDSGQYLWSCPDNLPPVGSYNTVVCDGGKYAIGEVELSCMQSVDPWAWCCNIEMFRREDLKADYCDGDLKPWASADSSSEADCIDEGKLVDPSATCP